MSLLERIEQKRADRAEAAMVARCQARLNSLRQLREAVRDAVRQVEARRRLEVALALVEHNRRRG